MSEWQDIASAPKDGTWVLLYGGVFSFDFYWDDPDPLPRVAVAFWDGECWSVAFWDGAWRDYYDAPTHWMPLPEPPK